MKYSLLGAGIAALALVGSSNAQMSPSPYYPNIGGNYICTDHCSPNGRIAKIGQDGGFLHLINEKNDGTSGYFESPTMIRARAGGGWDAIRAVIDGARINWENGTVWQKI